MRPSQSYWLRQSALGAGVSIPMALLVSAYLGEVLDLSASGWRTFVGSVAALVLPFFAGGMWVITRRARPLLEWIDEGPSGDAELDRVRFRALMTSPQEGVLIGGATWLLGGAAVIGIAWTAIPEFGGFDAAATAAACFLACMASGAFTYALSCRLLAGVRSHAASVLPADLRESCVRRIPIGVKLQIGFLATGLLPLLITAFLVQARGAAIEGLSMQVFLVAGIAGTFAVGLAKLLAREMADNARRLLEGLERVAARDLSRPVALESDDELGELARACARLADGVGEAVRRMAETAERVDSATATLGAAGHRVTDASSRQAACVAQANQALEGISAEARAMTERSGRLKVSVEDSSSTIVEHSAASQELREMANSLFEKIDQAVPALAQIAEGSEHISARVQALSRSSDEASAATQELAVAAEQIDREAAETGRLASSVVEASERGRQHVRSSDAGMRSIQDAVGGSAQAIEDLHERVTEISAVVHLIEEVADETHLLSLNAAIIAAQAGDEGRGFAVVADEVRGLAERVTHRTREISKIIESVEGSTERVDTAMAQSLAAVGDGLELWKGAGTVLEEIAQSASESGERVSEILRAIRSQGSATQQMRELIGGVSSDVGAIAGAVEAQSEGQRSVVEISRQIRDVAELVHRSVEEQAAGNRRLQDGVGVVEEATRHIEEGLESQSEAVRSAVERMGEVHERADEQQQAAERVAEGVDELARDAEALRREVGRFQLPGDV